MTTSTTPTTSTRRPSLASTSLALGLAGLLPVPGLIAAIAALVTGRLALRDDDGDAAQARAGVVLGALGIAAPLMFLLVYCGVLGYPFPIHPYRPD